MTNIEEAQREVCELKWEWQHVFPELDAHAFVIPGAVVKNKQDRLVVLNDVARKVVDSRRGLHDTHGSTYKGKPVTRMLNSA